MVDRLSVEVFQWLEYIGMTLLIQVGGNILARVNNVENNGYCAGTNKVFEYLG
jgi:hypothetical protein